MSTLIDSIPNRPADKPVFDFQITQGLCRVVLAPVSNDGDNLVVTGWAYRIESDGTPALDAATAAPIATTDSTRTIHLSGVMAGTHSLYDGWVRYVPPTQEVVNAENLPAGWTSGSGAPSGSASYGAGYYDTTEGLGYVYEQGCLVQAAQSFADALQAQIDTAAKLATLGI
jgi:hypothetical protein